MWHISGFVGVALLMAATVSAAPVRLMWDMPGSGLVPMGYTVYRRNQRTAPEVLAHMAPGQSEYTDAMPAMGLNCYYVTAFNAAGESFSSNEVCFEEKETPPATGGIPGAPRALRRIP